jgi:hypothetical protein
MLHIIHHTPFKEKAFPGAIVTRYIFYFMGSLALLFMFLPTPSLAQESCGSIYHSFFGDDEPIPIEDCADPFGLASAQAVGDFGYSIDGIPLVQNGMHESETFPVTITLTSEIDPVYNSKRFDLYRHEGDDYHLVNAYLGVLEPITLTAFATGTYSIVATVEQLIIIGSEESSWWSKVFNHIIPTAYAQLPPSPVMSVLTFTLTEPAIAEGTANVLFIPGIMGSRLYEVGNFCGGDSVDDEQELWFSTDACKQFRLTTMFTGQSDNDIYTKTNDEGVFDDAFYFVNIYDSFLDQLNEWKDDELINNYAVFPYDWRLSLDDILKSRYDRDSGKTFPGVETSVTDGLLYKLIEQLARSAQNEKVTIVAHSNGGLVIKQLISHLEVQNDPLLDVIDAVVLVAVPQLGAPNTVVGILHGEELNNVMAQSTTRQLMNTMPFSYHLLPTAQYFDTVSTPPVTIEPGTVTDVWQETFGDEFTNLETLHNFLSRESGREEPSPEDLTTPEVSDPLLLQYANTTEVMQTNFNVPTGIRVYQIAGTGLPTPSQLTYFTDRACVNRTFFLCTEYAPKLGYRVVTTVDGDATVPVPSSLALPESDNVERWWLDIASYNSDGIFGLSNNNREHKNLFEINEISIFINDLIQNHTVKEYNYISSSEPDINDDERLIFQLHSPLDLSLETGSGQVVSSSTNDIPGALYRRYGELQYISVPRTEDLELVLVGQGTGSFTLDIEEVADREVVERVTMSGLPVSTSTSVRMAVGTEDNIEELVLSVDYDGDGEVDVEYDADGMREENEVTYDDLYTAISEANLKRGPEAVLRALAKTAERFAKKSERRPIYAKLEQKSLESLIRQSILYRKLRFLTSEEQERIKKICTDLINK